MKKLYSQISQKKLAKIGKNLSQKSPSLKTNEKHWKSLKSSVCQFRGLKNIL